MDYERVEEEELHWDAFVIHLLQDLFFRFLSNCFIAIIGGVSEEKAWLCYRHVEEVL